MDIVVQKWQTQIRKGYLELCVLTLVSVHEKVYGFEMIELMNQVGLHVKEGTLYPLLNRLKVDDLLQARWETENSKHPRKFYSITKKGRLCLEQMESEFGLMAKRLKKMSTQGVNNG
ncbi:MAG: PadR family transcriptional regulator [Bdellovibrionota bacterium]